VLLVSILFLRVQQATGCKKYGAQPEGGGPHRGAQIVAIHKFGVTLLKGKRPL
jgi:hypothetical protein